MICLKIRTFVVSATTFARIKCRNNLLWFAWKFVPLWYQQQRLGFDSPPPTSCDLLENSYLCGISNNLVSKCLTLCVLWFAWKFVPLWYQQQLYYIDKVIRIVVICLKIRTFVVSATTRLLRIKVCPMLWFAWKFVPLWYQQQHTPQCTLWHLRCDLLENSYLCGISNNQYSLQEWTHPVVICLKIRTFVVSATTEGRKIKILIMLWFAWKFVPLWYQQQLLLK